MYISIAILFYFFYRHFADFLHSSLLPRSDLIYDGMCMLDLCFVYTLALIEFWQENSLKTTNDKKKFRGNEKLKRKLFCWIVAQFKWESPNWKMWEQKKEKFILMSLSSHNMLTLESKRSRASFFMCVYFCIFGTRIHFDLFLNLHTRYQYFIWNACTLIYWDCHNTHKFPVTCASVIIFSIICLEYTHIFIFQCSNGECQFEIWRLTD